MRQKNTWFPLKNFTKLGCHKDWQLGPGSWRVKDFLTGEIIKPLETIFWNRTFHNATVSLENYKRIVKEKNPDMMSKMNEIGLPTDINI